MPTPLDIWPDPTRGGPRRPTLGAPESVAPTRGGGRWIGPRPALDMWSYLDRQSLHTRNWPCDQLQGVWHVDGIARCAHPHVRRHPCSHARGRIDMVACPHGPRRAISERSCPYPCFPALKNVCSTGPAPYLDALPPAVFPTPRFAVSSITMK